MSSKKNRDLQNQLVDMLVDEAEGTRAFADQGEGLKTAQAAVDVGTAVTLHKVEGAAIIERIESATQKSEVKTSPKPSLPPPSSTAVDTDKTSVKQAASAELKTMVVPKPESVENRAPVNLDKTQYNSKSDGMPAGLVPTEAEVKVEEKNWSFSQVGFASETMNKERAAATSHAQPARFVPREALMSADMGQEVALVQSEHLRLAQERILELEDMLSRLRVENEQLVAAGETLRNRADELFAKSETSESEAREKLGILQEEKVLLESHVKSKNKEIQELKLKVEELDMRLNTDMKRVRVRERELENRLELIKLEGSTVLRSKDEMILELKRKLDQLSFEIDNYRTKGKELNKRLELQQDRARRTVKALRLALSMLDGEESEATPIKKAE